TPGDCGTCGHSCNGDQQCVNGGCICRPGLTSCNGFCVDLQRDGDNCGSCGNGCNVNANERCALGKCVQGLCNSMGQYNCNNGCYTQQQLENDPVNCGGCGNVCDPTQVC